MHGINFIYLVIYFKAFFFTFETLFILTTIFFYKNNVFFLHLHRIKLFNNNFSSFILS